MKLTIVDGPAPESQKREWASWTGLPVLVESTLGPLETCYVLDVLESSGNGHCILVPSSQLPESSLAEYVDLYGCRVQFQWMNAESPPPEEK